MAQPVVDSVPPWDEAAVSLAVGDHLGRFAEVLRRAWRSYAAVRDGAPAEMALTGPSSRGLMLWELTKVPAHQVFAGVPGVRVEDRYGSAWVVLAGGRVQVRFRKLTPAFELAPCVTDRALALAFHHGDPLIPDVPAFTVLTAGYVLDAAELSVRSLALVCHVGRQPHYVIPLPADTDGVTGATQLPLAPLPDPVIRSARETVTRRLTKVPNDSA